MLWIRDCATGDIRFFAFGSVIFDEVNNLPVYWLEGDRVLEWADRSLAFTIDADGRFFEPGCPRPLLYFTPEAWRAIKEANRASGHGKGDDGVRHDVRSQPSPPPRTPQGRG